MKGLVLESTAPFQGLPELVAYDEGLFEKEGLHVEWVDRDAGAERKKTALHVTGPQGLNPFTSHGRLFEQGQADMYNACEWGNYCRVQETGIKSRQLGRRAIIAYGAIVVPAGSPVPETSACGALNAATDTAGSSAARLIRLEVRNHDRSADPSLGQSR
jgi:NitT/TauT family transport system substrate-binding protein